MSGGAAHFPQNARAALKDARVRAAQARIKEGFRTKRATAMAGIRGGEGLREAGRAIRDASLADLAPLLETFERNVAARGGRVHWARDAREARDIVLALLREAGARTVTKGKSMIAEEIGLNAHLEANGIEPVETDLGEYIIHLRHETPSHIIAPAIHLDRGDVRETFLRAHAGLDPGRDIDARKALVAEARAVLRARFLASDAGITGANFLAAEEGAAVIVTNEGNGDLCRLVPRTHIVLASIEKVVPSLGDVAVLLRLLTRSATGQDITAYVTVAAGPKRGEDADGPEAFHVVLIDNGRSALLGTDAEATLRCIRCGACMNHCPVYAAVGGHAYGTVYPGPIGAALNPALIGVSEARHHANASTFCGRCAEVCPVKIPLPAIMRHWRAREAAEGHAPRAAVLGLRLWGFLARQPRLYHAAARIAVRILKLFARGRGRVRALPVFGGWFAVRDLPAPQGRTFMEQWRR